MNLEPTPELVTPAQNMTADRFGLFISNLKDVNELSALLDSLPRNSAVELCQSTDSHGLTPLLRACMNSNTDAVRVLIERGAAPVNSTNELGTPLHKAAWGGKLAIVQMLLAHRADVNAIEAPTMETPIFDAAKNGHAPVLRCLIEHGARVDLANREHCSVLRTANVAHHVACVAALFAAGADAHRVDQRCIEWARPYTTGVALHARSSHAAAVVQGALLVCGGDLGAVVSKPAEEFYQLDLNASFMPFAKQQQQQPTVNISIPKDSADADDDDGSNFADNLADEAEAWLAARRAERSIRPTSFVADPKFNRVLSVVGTQLEYTYEGDVDLGIALSDAPLAANINGNIAYFEVSIHCAGRRNFIAVGVADPRRTPPDKLPGWFSGSVAFHGDDGKKYVGLPYGQQFGPKFTTGDTVGVGVNLVRGEVFFTMNGSFIGVAYRARPHELAGMHAAVGLYSLGERVEVNLGGERPFEFEFQTDQLSWAQPQLFGDVPAHFRTIPRLVSLGDSAILFSSRLNEHFVITGSAADQRWRFDRRIVMTPPETERISHDLTEYCIDSGELYALAQVAREPLLVLKFVMQPPAGGYWDVIEAAEDSPLQQAPIVTGASFVAIGDGLLAVLGGRRPTTDNRRDDENVPPIDDAVRQATYFFDLRRRHWLGVDQIVNGESGRSDAIESLLQVGVGRGATALGGGACGALLFGGWDSRRMRPDCIVMSVERVPVDVRRDHLRVVVSSPHLSGTSPVPRNRVALCSLGDGRFVASFGWDGSKRSADVDIGVMRANTSLQTRLLRALSTGAFSDTTLECDDRTRFAVHALVLQRRCSGLGALLRADGAASNVHRVRLSSSAHVALLLHYAYGDVLPSDTCMTSNEVRSFLNDCVAQLAPEHSERLTELLVSIRLATSSRFASDMTGAFALDSAAASDSDAELVLSDGRVAHVHRAVLTSGSAYFRGCFESMLADPTRRRIDVSEDDSALVLALLEHLYCGECEFDDELGGRVVELLSVACKFGCEELALRCEALMLPLVDASNARWLLAHANSLARPKLAAQCRDVLLRAGDGVAD